jgi:hypothetical protein
MIAFMPAHLMRLDPALRRQKKPRAAIVCFGNEDRLQHFETARRFDRRVIPSGGQLR